MYVVIMLMAANPRPIIYLEDRVEIVEYHTFFDWNGFHTIREINFWDWYESDDGKAIRELHIVASYKRSDIKMKPIYVGRGWYVMSWREHDYYRRVYTRAVVETYAYESRGQQHSSQADKKVLSERRIRGHTIGSLSR